MSIHRGLAIVLWLLGFAMLPLDVAAQDADDTGGKQKKPREQMHMWRFELDNDFFFGSDYAFSNGWSLQRHSPAVDTWDVKPNGKRRAGFSRWIGNHFPGLEVGGTTGKVGRRTIGISQIIQTPEDISNPDPQPHDVPWAGTAGLHESWISFDNVRLYAFQIFVGVMGPASLAEETQTFVHEDLGLGDPPQGWDNQLENQFIGNLNYALRRKLAAPPAERYAAKRFAGDLAIGGQAGLGNFFRFVEAQLELRFGWGLPPGFTHIPDAPGRGIMMEPSPGAPSDHWDFYFSIVPRYTYYDAIATMDGGDTYNGGFHPGVDYDKNVFQTLFGLHVGKKRFSAHITYYYFPSAELINVPTETSLSWANVSLEYRF
jgi:hypothetical protein